jgi:hypothetical protein
MFGATLFFEEHAHRGTLVLLLQAARITVTKTLAVLLYVPHGWMGKWTIDFCPPV